MVADARLSTAFQGDMTKAGSSTLAVQRFLAQTPGADLQDPNKQRSVVVAPQRMPTASQAQTMAQALTALQAGSWSQPQDLSRPPPRPSPTRRHHAGAVGAPPYPDVAAQAGAAHVGLRADRRPRRTTLDNFKVILTEPDRVVTPFGSAIDREMSTSWRGRAVEASELPQRRAAYLDELTDRSS